MKRRDAKDLDQLLKTFFQQEGETLTPPSSMKRWAELRTRLENQESPALSGEISKSLEEEERSLIKRGYGLFRQHKALTSLAAACLLVAIYFAGLPPIDTLKQSFWGVTTTSEADEAYFAVETSGERMEAETPLPQGTPPDPGADPEQEVILADLPSTEEIPPLEVEVDTAEVPDEARDPRVQTPEQPSEETLALESQPAAEMDMAREATSSFGFSEHSDFINSLKGLPAPLIVEEIWYFQEAPPGFVFVNAVISRSDTALHAVTQSFSSSDGERRLSINQSFFLSTAEAGAAYYSLDELAVPVQVGPYEGSLFRQQGINTITWLQEKSVVSLSGQLEDEQLFEVIEALESISSPLEP